MSTAARGDPSAPHAGAAMSEGARLASQQLWKQRLLNTLAAGAAASYLA